MGIGSLPLALSDDGMGNVALSKKSKTCPASVVGKGFRLQRKRYTIVGIGRGLCQSSKCNSQVTERL